MVYTFFTKQKKKVLEVELLTAAKIHLCNGVVCVLAIPT